MGLHDTGQFLEQLKTEFRVIFPCDLKYLPPQSVVLRWSLRVLGKLIPLTYWATYVHRHLGDGVYIL